MLWCMTVAEHMRIPLYSVTAGELGTQIYHVEESLGNVLELATRWNAVLLLDEADVFLAQRANNEIERNKLVSGKARTKRLPHVTVLTGGFTVFLRTLEYYKGILLITTNRESSIDSAFTSRFDLNLRYPSLSTDTQKEIWKRLVTKSSAKAASFKDEDWACFTTSQMNGREIKNAVKLACLLATRRKEDLAPSHIEEVIQALYGDLWNGYLSRVGDGN